MPLPVQCPGCGTKLRAPDTAAGKSLKCPSCAAVVPVPAATSPITPRTEDTPTAPTRREKPAAPPSDEPRRREQRDEPQRGEQRRERNDADDDRDRPPGRRRNGDDERDDDRRLGRRRHEGGRDKPTNPFVYYGVILFAVAVFGLGGLVVLANLVAAIRPGVKGDGNAANAPAITIDADDLFAEYDANEVAADNKYRGKTLLVTGTIKEIGKNVFDRPFVALVNERSQFMTAVRCEFPRNASGLAVLGKGQDVTIRGKCRGYSIRTVQLEDCKLE